MKTIDTFREEKKSELLDRLEKNFADYKETLMSFTKQELIDMSAKIHAMSDAHSYMTYWNDLSDEDIDFYLEFQNPLEVVAGAWCEQNTDLSEMSYTLDALINRADEILAENPLVTDADAPIDNSLRRFMHVDLNDFLGKIAKQVIIHYPSDFSHDMKVLRAAENAEDFNDRRFVWHVCSYGTHIAWERDVFIKDTGDNVCMTNYSQDEPNMFGYIVEVIGKKGESIIGNVFEVGNYAEYAKHINETVEPYESVKLSYSNEWGVYAGKTVTVTKKDYEDNYKSLMSEKGAVAKVAYIPQDESKHAAILSEERSRRMLYPIGSTKRHLIKLNANLAEIRDTNKTSSTPPVAKQSINKRLKRGAEMSRNHRPQKQKQTSQTIIH